MKSFGSEKEFYCQKFNPIGTPQLVLTSVCLARALNSPSAEYIAPPATLVRSISLTFQPITMCGSPARSGETSSTASLEVTAKSFESGFPKRTSAHIVGQSSADQTNSGSTKPSEFQVIPRASRERQQHHVRPRFQERFAVRPLPSVGDRS